MLKPLLILGCLVLTTAGMLAGQPDAPVFAPAHCQVEGRIDKRLATVVITHGWRYRNRDFVNPTPELQELGREIRQRIDSEGVAPVLHGQRVNVIYYVWPEASRPLFNGSQPLWRMMAACRHASKPTAEAGMLLAGELRRILGDDYRQPVQFIGHSFGAMINAYAVRELADHSRWHCEAQFTVLDSAICWTLPGERGFKQLLPATGAMKVAWVDNYVGIPFVGVGSKLFGAGPGWRFSGGKRVPRTHCGVLEYYRETIRDRTRRTGFYYSLLLGNRGGWTVKTPAAWMR